MEKKEQVRRFFKEASTNEEIKTDLAKHDNPDAIYKKAVEHGANLGYDFSEEDLRKHTTVLQDQELSDRELGMSGGDVNSDIKKGVEEANSYLATYLFFESC